ncbi:MAG: helix-turn-helix domain-containing protein [Nitrososphaerota archaeon]|nr:helix-turn-helix domain-containing protein [Nitrososphaerota archaeon]
MRDRKYMTHYEVAFKLQHDCPYNEFSKTHPDTVISHWCNWRKDILEIAHKDLQNEQVQQGIRKLIRALNTKVIRKSNATSNLQVVLQQCACDNIPPPTVPMIEQHNCLELQPAVYTQGWEWYRVIAFSEKDIKSLFKDLDRFGVQVVSRRTVLDESVRDTFVLSTATLFGDLTDKQLKALITALDNGYYNMPRSATAEEIAKRAGVPRTSFVDHLRKAENKVLRSVGPYLRLKPEEPRKSSQPTTDI